MTHISVRRFSIGSLLLATMLLAALLIGVQAVSAQQGVTWESGNFCVQDYRPGAVCTANDVRIANIQPSLSEVCLVVGDTATVTFTLDIVTGAQTRYDIGLFIDQSGTAGGALSGDNCYHDFLQPPAATSPNDGNPTNPAGVGPFANYDGDTCADTKQATNAFYTTQVAVSIPCVDNNSDGIVDPISTCTSWDNNAGTLCTDVKQAFPGTNSKCNCETIPTNVKIYRGIDGGDLPDTYGTLFTNDGARHAIQDANSNGTPDSIGGTIAIWLGPTVDYAWVNPADETNSGGFPSPDALGDDGNNTDDENGVAFVGPWNNGGRIDVLVNASATGECTTGNNCTVALWLDWDNDGAFDNTDFNAGTNPTGERYLFTLTNGTGTTYQLTFDTPDSWTTPLAARVRLYDNAPGSAAPSPVGLALNGEVEDYIVTIGPLAVTLADFSAQCVSGSPVITWETVSELTNQGFNLYRGLDSASPDTQLNASLIPSQGPGSAQGFVYTWTDGTAQPETEYFYWLEDVDFSGATGTHGPVSAMCSAPTAVGLSSLGTASPTPNPALWWAVALALAAVLGGLVAVQRRSKA